MGVEVPDPVDRRIYREVPRVPDRREVERAALDRWERSAVFERVREAGRGGEPFSFVDGPITANNPMGVHHAWGRTLKDIVQRYHAMLGRELRWQNGFDCQGLWVEVEVERSLGLDAKDDIEDLGLDRFSRACRDRVAHHAEVIRTQSQRLGMWMDWDRSYFTMADANVSAIWGFLATCHERGWLYRGDRLMPWCVRCGTSLSQHELADSYQDLRHPSLSVLLPLAERSGEHLAVWTTTPWTLPANVAAAVHPSASYVRVPIDAGTAIVAADRVADLPWTGDPQGVVAGSDLVELTYRSPFRDLPAQRGITHRVVGWDGVSLGEGTGVVHIAPGCGEEDHGLGQREGLDVISPLDGSGRFTDRFGSLDGLTTDEATQPIIDHLAAAGALLEVGEVTHRYPVCWRCSTPLVHRLVDEWFLATDPIRERLIREAAEVEWRPVHAGKQMRAWLENMGDWCISRRRYWGLPLPFWFCEEGHLTVIRSERDLRDRALSGTDDLHELHRPWIDDVVIACESCGLPSERVEAVGDCWLDAGIVPLSTLGWGNDSWVDGGYATGAATGLTTADLPDHDHWRRWFPAEWVCEMREQVRLWFYSMLFMGVTLTGRAPYRRVLSYGRINDEHGREMHRSSGNAIWFDDAVDEMAADTMRWLFAGQDPARDLDFGPALAEDIERRFLTVWNVYSFLAAYAEIARWTPSPALLDHGPDPEGLGGLDRWMLARTNAFVAASRETLDAFDTPAFTVEAERYWSDLSNWYLRRSRRRAWAAADGGETDVFDVLWYGLTTLARCLAPVTPFIADEIWRNLVCAPLGDVPDSVHLSGFPEPDPRHQDEGLLRRMGVVRRVAELGRAARADGQVRLRQPLPALLVASHDERHREGVEAHADLVAEECNVREVRFIGQPDDLARTEAVPDFAVLGPRHGPRAQKIGRRLRDGTHEWDGEDVRIDGVTLAKDEYTLRLRARDGLCVAEDDGLVVALETDLTPELILEGRARDLVRDVQNRRRELDLDVTDRVAITYPRSAEDVVATHGEWIAAETLADRMEAGDDLAVRRLRRSSHAVEDDG